MRWLIISDIHGDVDTLGRILETAGVCDLVICAGDLTDFGDASEARALLALLVGRPVPLMAVSGNCDRDGVRTVIETAAVSIEGRARGACGHIFVGAGGGLHRHGMTPFEATEDELEAMLRAGLDRPRGAPQFGTDGPLVVVTHTPPNGTNLDRRGASHVGSHAFRTLLAELRPLLWISGHIHESFGTSVVGGSILVNPGSAREGRYALAEFVPGESPRIDLRSISPGRPARDA